MLCLPRAGKLGWTTHQFVFDMSILLKGDSAGTPFQISKKNRGVAGRLWHLSSFVASHSHTLHFGSTPSLASCTSIIITTTMMMNSFSLFAFLLLLIGACTIVESSKIRGLTKNTNQERNDWHRRLGMEGKSDKTAAPSVSAFPSGGPTFAADFDSAMPSLEPSKKPKDKNGSKSDKTAAPSVSSFPSGGPTFVLDIDSAMPSLEPSKSKGRGDFVDKEDYGIGEP